MDVDGSGTVSQSEVVAWISQDGGVSMEDAEKLMKSYDRNSDGVVTFIEFLQGNGFKLNDDWDFALGS